jgi:hypothetical protein
MNNLQDRQHELKREFDLLSDEQDYVNDNQQSRWQKRLQSMERYLVSKRQTTVAPVSVPPAVEVR